MTWGKMMALAELLFWTMVASSVALALRPALFGPLVTTVCVAAGALSLSAILKAGFNITFAPAVEDVLTAYETATDAALSGVINGWLLSELRAQFPDAVSPLPHWKHIFIFLMVIYLNKAFTGFRTGNAAIALTTLTAGSLLSFVASVLAGSIPLDASGFQAAFSLAAIPIIADFLVSVIEVIAVAIFLPRFYEGAPWWIYVGSTWSYRFRVAFIGLVIAAVGLPLVQSTSSPGIVVLGFAVLVYSLSSLGLYWRQSRESVVAIIPLIFASAGVLWLVSSRLTSELPTVALDGIAFFVAGALAVAAAITVIGLLARNLTSGATGHSAPRRTEVETDGPGRREFMEEQLEGLKKEAGIENRPEEGPWYAGSIDKAVAAGIYDAGVGNPFRPPVDFPQDYAWGFNEVKKGRREEKSSSAGGRLSLVLLVILAVAFFWYYTAKVITEVSGPPEPSSSAPSAVQEDGSAYSVPVQPGAQSEPPLLFTWENWTDPPFTAEYRQKYGTAPKTSLWADEDEAFAKMTTGYKPDVMGPCSYEFERWRDAGLIQPIDVTKLKHWRDIPASLKAIPGMMKSETEAWFIPQYWASTSVTYRTDLAPEYVGKESWKILFDPKYRGRVAGLDGVDDTVALIAKTWGIDPYNMTDDQWKIVQEKLREFVANARFISSDETSLSQALASGEIVAAITWNHTHAALKREGRPVAFMNPPGGRLTYVCGLVMHAESTKLEQNYALIDSGISPTAMRYQLETLNNAPANVSILGDYTDEQLEQFGFGGDFESFLRPDMFQVRLKDKEGIKKFWIEIRGGG